MTYSEAQDELVQRFRDLAVAYDHFVKAGGEVEFKIYRQELLLNIKEGASIGFLIQQS
jgi:hypothetical protein